MFENYIYTLASRSGVVSDWIRVFFAGICKFVYSFIASMYDTIKVIADREYLGLGNYAEDMASKIFFALVIFMIFKLTITFLSYLVSPDTFSDANKGVQNIIKRIIISIVLLVSINPLFNILYNVQDELLNDDAISSIVLGSSSDAIYQSSEGATYYFTKISDICDNNKKAVTSSTGEHFALLTLRPFIQPSDYVIDDDGTVVSEGLMSSDSYYCGQEIDTSKDEIYIENYNLNTEYYLSSDVITDTAKEENSLSMVDYYRIDFNFFFALVVGIVVFLLLLNLSFDVVVRAFTLLILQVVAPIPIINYVTPGNKGSEMLSSWGKKLFSTWASLFIRLLSITLAVSFVGAICENGTISNKGGLVIQIIVIIGALIFAKQLPKLLEELFPGMKLGGGGFNLNPFKRIREDALGGKAISNVTSATAGMALGAAGGGLAGFKAGSEVSNLRRGVVLGSVGGALYGRKNPKGAFIKSAGNAYKTLSGNELKRFDPLKSIGTKKAEPAIAEVKGALKDLRNKKSKLEQRLAETSHVAVKASESLVEKGYNINNLPTYSEQQKDNIRKNAQIAYSNRQRQQQLQKQLQNVKAQYDASNNTLKNTERYAKDVNGNIMLDSQNRRIETAEYKNAINDFKIKEQNYNKVKNELESLSKNIQSDNLAIKDYNTLQEVNTYTNAYKEALAIRTEINTLDKQISTMSSEKSERETFYQVDTSPKGDVQSILKDYHDGNLK